MDRLSLSWLLLCLFIPGVCLGLPRTARVGKGSPAPNLRLVVLPTSASGSIAARAGRAAPAVTVLPAEVRAACRLGDGDAVVVVPSLSAARDAVRAHKLRGGGVAAPGAIEVLVAPGEHFQAEPLALTPEDSGTERDPIRYTGCTSGGAAAAAGPVISGGLAVTGWTQVSPTPAGINGTLWSAQLPVGTTPFSQLWANGTRQVLARTPVMAYQAASTNSIIYKPGQVAGTPANLADVRVVLYESWTASLHRIASIDTTTRNITLTTLYNNKWSGSAAGSRYYLDGLREALDEAGEFYYERASRTLSWVGAAGADPNAVAMVVPQTAELVTLLGDPDAGRWVEHLSFEGLTFAYTAADLGTCFAGSCDGQSGDFLNTSTVRLYGARGCSFDRIAVEHTGGYGWWSGEATFNNTLANSVLSDLGAGAVRVGIGHHGAEPRPAHRCEGVRVTNNVLTDGGHVIQEGCGVLAQAVAHTEVSHNLIASFRYTGVSMGWNWGYAATSTHSNNISFNAIHDIGMSTLSDMGCVYTLGIQPGTEVVNNFCHSVFSYNYGGWAYYTDEGSTNLTFRDNVATNTKCAGHHQHYGMDNLLTNNIYADVDVMACDGVFRSSQHPGHSVDCQHIVGGDEGECSSLKLMTNVLYTKGKSVLYCTIPYGLLNSSLDNNTDWSTAEGAGVAFPTNTSDHSFAEWRSEGKDTHSILADPQFANATAGDYSKLLPSSPALQRGFKPISLARVGPQADSVGPGSLDPAAYAALRDAAFRVPTARPAPLTPDERALHDQAWLVRQQARR